MPLSHIIARQDCALAHAEWAEADGELIETYRQAAAAERSDAFQLPEDIMSIQDQVQAGDVTMVATVGANKVAAFDADGVQGLPVAGYKKTQPPHLIALVNQNKILEEAALRQVDHIKTKFSGEVDPRDLAIAKTELENAFMRLNRAIFQPQRIDSGPDSDKARAILKAAGSKASASVEELSS